MLAGVAMITSQVITATEFDDAFCTAAIENDGTRHALSHTVLKVHYIARVVNGGICIVVIGGLTGHGNRCSRTSTENVDL